jgi:hypothetical protein
MRLLSVLRPDKRGLELTKVDFDVHDMVKRAQIHITDSCRSLNRLKIDRSG